MALHVLNVSALITGYETVGDHTEFIVQISCNGGLWLISRRFSDFDQLHSRLQRSFGDLIGARIPEKQWFGRFDPNFLLKRQSGLQEYLESLLLVPGILEDRSLQHFLELEKHLELQGDIGLGGPNGVGRPSTGLLSTKSMILNENDRLNTIVENAAQTFIDISEVPEPLELDQAEQRKLEIASAAETHFNETKFIEGFKSSVQVLRLPQPPVVRYTSDHLVGRLESPGYSYEQDQELVLTTLQSVNESLRLTIMPPSSDLIAFMAGAAVLTNGVHSNGSAVITDGDDWS